MPAAGRGLSLRYEVTSATESSLAPEPASLLAAYPSASMTVVGPLLDEPHFAAVRAEPNVHLHGAMDREAIVSLVSAADVCLLPHVRNALTEAMSPLKLYEYLASGLPAPETR